MTAIVHDIESDLSVEEPEDDGQGDEAFDEREIIREEVEGEDEQGLEVHEVAGPGQFVLLHVCCHSLFHGPVEQRVVCVKVLITYHVVKVTDHLNLF